MPSRPLTGARVFARSAAILRGAGDVAPRAWQQCAAVALGLAEGRPLKKTPVFDVILDQTLRPLLRTWLVTLARRASVQ